MLKQLVDYAVKHDVETEPGFVSDHIRWAIVLDSKKRFLGVQELGETSLGKNNIGRFFKKCPELSQAEMVSAKEGQFLSDDAAVLTGENEQRYNSFVGLLADAGKIAPQLNTVSALLKDPLVLEVIKRELKQKGVRSSDNVTIMLDGQFLLEQDNWHDWWRNHRRPLVKKIDEEMLCLINGERVKPIATHYKIKKLAGGRSTGDSLASFDKAAFESYGLTQSANASVSEQAMCAYRAGLNDLIRNHSQGLVGAKVVHWFKAKVVNEEDLFEYLIEPLELVELNAQHKAKRLLESIRKGERPDLASNSYYAMTLSGAGGRVMVRDWMEGQFEELVSTVNQWFDDLEIVNLSGEKSAKSPGLERAVTCLLPLRKPNQKYDDWVKPVGGERLALLHAAVKGMPVAHSVISRLAIEHRSFILGGKLEELLKNGARDSSTGLMYSLLYARMGLVKAWHIRKYRKEGNTTMSDMLKPALNEDFPSPAYQCGRLMAVLAELQRRAMPNVEAGIVQRYYAAASTTPSLVLGRLIKLSMFHMDKLKSKASSRWFEKKISDVSKHIMEPPPRALSLEEQSLFALGYYQQLADMDKAKTTNNEEEFNG